MDYRKIVNGKKKISAAFDGVKNFATDKSKEVKEYTGNTMDEFKDNIKNTANDVKTSISNTVKTKFENEFRKNYPSYAISYVDSYIVDSFAKDVDKVVISLDDGDGVLSISNIFNEISDGMLSDTLMGKYRTPYVFDSLFGYLSLYYSTEPNLDVKTSCATITISLPKETSEDEEVENVEEFEDVE